MDKINLNIVLIAGYTTHGKSTFKDYLLGKNKVQENIINLVEDKKINHSLDYFHYYFSQPVKKEIAIMNKITLEQLNQDKEKYRNQMIESCIKHLSENEYYYVDYFINLVSFHIDFKKKLQKTNLDYIIDDWRLKCEYKRIFEVFSQDNRVNLNIITVRVVNQKAQIPDLTRIEEHDLDDVLTDNLVLTEDTSLEYVKSIFPQYI